MLDAAELKRLRKGQGLSQEELARVCFDQRLCVSIASIKRAETGKPVLYRTARHLAEVYRVDVARLLAPPSQAEGHEPPASLSAAPPAQPLAPGAAALSVQRSVVHLLLVWADTATVTPECPWVVQDQVKSQGGLVVAANELGVVVAFGHEQAHASDAARALACARSLATSALAPALAQMRVGWALESPSRPPGTSPAWPALNDVRWQALDTPPGQVPLWVAPDFPLAPLATPLVGRSTELRQFESALSVMLDEQSGHAVYLRGMAGVGKTHLRQALLALSQAQGVSTHLAELADFGSVDWCVPLGVLARSLMGAPHSLPEQMAAAIDEAVLDLALPTDGVLYLRAITGTPMSSVQARLFEALSPEQRLAGKVKALHRLIQRRAIERPQLLCVEDLHWGDPLLWHTLSALIALTRDEPVLWLLSARPEGCPLAVHMRPRLSDAALSVFELGPLRAADALALADQFTGVDAEHRRQCVARAQGHPLFLTQLLAHPGGHLPHSLQHLLQSRLDQLSVSERHALSAAAVLGHRFDLALWRTALQRPDFTPDAAWQHGFIRPVGDGQYAFVHDLVLQAIYEAIDPAQRRQLHRSVAALHMDRDLALAAQHLCRAQDPTALVVLVQAVHLKLQAHQHEAALELLSLAPGLSGATAQAFTLTLLRARAHAGAGHVSQARDDHEHALSLARSTREHLEVVLGLAPLLNLLDRLSEEEQLLDEALPLARAIHDDTALAQLCSLKGNIHFPRGDYQQCRHWHGLALQHAVSDAQMEHRVRALSGMGDAWYAQGHMGQAHEMFDQCVSLCAAHGLAHAQAANLSARGSAFIYLGQPDQALGDALQAATLGVQTGHRRAEMFSRLTAAWVLQATGQFSQAREEVLAGRDLARSLGAARFEPFFMETMARISWAMGDHARAHQEILWAAQEVERLSLQRFIGPWVMGTLACFSQDEPLREQALQMGGEQLSRGGLAHNAYRFLVSAAEVSLQRGDVTQALHHAEVLGRYGLSEPCPWVDHHLQLIRAHAQWLTAPEEAVMQKLQHLTQQAAALGYTHVTPGLYQPAL